jgi:hypothetical protein
MSQRDRNENCFKGVCQYYSIETIEGMAGQRKSQFAFSWIFDDSETAQDLV